MTEINKKVVDDARNIRFMGQMYFISIIPFIGAAVVPWVLGPEAIQNSPLFLVWSVSVLIFICGGWLGYNLSESKRLSRIHILVNVIFVTSAVACLLFSLKQSTPFSVVAILTFIHWLNLFWMQKTRSWSALPKEISKLHLRFIWTALACHMLVLFDLIYLIRVQ